MRGMEQRAMSEVLQAQGGTLTKRGDAFAGGGSLVNRQRSYDPARLQLDQRTSRYKRAFAFEQASKDASLWARVKEAFEL